MIGVGFAWSGKVLNRLPDRRLLPTAYCAMTYRLPACIVLEIPSPVREAVKSIRVSLATIAARLPVEITVAGSSGVGPIPAGIGKKETEERVRALSREFEPFNARFQEIRRFPNTDIFYLAPEDRQPFDRIHKMLKTSGIPFGPNPWPYNPHCTLRAGPLTDPASADDIFKLPFPKHEFVIDTVSIYELDVQVLTCHLSFQTKLRSDEAVSYQHSAISPHDPDG
jgi:2'-5' RNA ligase